MELVQPSEKYKESFIAAVKEFQAEKPITSRHEYYQALSIDELRSNFGTYLRGLDDATKGINLPRGYVPQSTFWLVNGDEFIGRVTIRHSLNDNLQMRGGHIGYDIRASKRERGYGNMILQLALPKAKALGIERVLLTCDETNIASRKIIEGNGGVFEDKKPNPKGGSDTLRYWIAL